MVERLGLAHHAPLSQLLIFDPLASLDFNSGDGSPSSDLVLLLLLLLTSSDAEPYPLIHVPRCRSPSSLAAYRLGPVVESQDPEARPLLDGAAWWVNRQSSRLLHGLLRSGGVAEPEGPASLDESADNSPDTMREGVGEVGGMVVVHGASDPWGRPRGLIEMHAIWRITDTPTGPVTTEMWRSSSSSSPSSSP
jgi:hypothetical protein